MFIKLQNVTFGKLVYAMHGTYYIYSSCSSTADLCKELKWSSIMWPHELKVTFCKCFFSSSTSFILFSPCCLPWVKWQGNPQCWSYCSNTKQWVSHIDEILLVQVNNWQEKHSWPKYSFHFTIQLLHGTGCKIIVNQNVCVIFCNGQSWCTYWMQWCTALYKTRVIYLWGNLTRC